MKPNSTENLFKTDCIRTHTGLYMNVFCPTPEMICIEDIAHSLSHQCRFGGHLPQFYSVAQHCVNVASIVPPELRLAALLHDASEAYLLDMPSPIKRKMPEYRAIEDKLMKVIAQKLNFDYPVHDEIKLVDNKMLQFEWDFLMQGFDKPKHLVKTECYTSSEAKKLFLEKYKHYDRCENPRIIPVTALCSVCFSQTDVKAGVIKSVRLI
jgi:hypothetical protein